MVSRAVFLDRDGVLNLNMFRDGKLVAPSKSSDFRLVPDAKVAVQRLKAEGFVVIVVTNQPDLATGRTSWREMEAMHAELRRCVPVDDIRVCPHVDEDGCTCRKPQPGLLVDASRDYQIALHESYLVGDRWRDIWAGRAAGCCTILIASDAQAGGKECQPNLVATSLSEAVDLIVRDRHRVFPERRP
jgi:D-glycero-D-manno-heptose 1,7-bisphosphate phosphatase